MSDEPVSVELLLAQRPWVEALARRLVADEATAADVVQQTWLAALTRPPRTAQSLRTWLTRVTRNSAFETHRRAERRERRESAAVRTACEPSPGEIVAKAEAHRRVVDAVMALDEPYRSVVLLRFFEGLETDEVARRIGVPHETARTRLKRAIATLRARLDRDHGGDGRACLAVLVPVAGGARRFAETTAASAGAVSTGGAVVAVSTKVIAAASLVAGLAIGAVATGIATSVRSGPDETAPPAKETAGTPPANRRDRHAAALPAPHPAENESLLARAIDSIDVAPPPTGTGSVTGHVVADGKPFAGVLVRAWLPRPADAKAPGPARTPSVEDAVRDAVVDAKWHAATTREATTDAAGAYTLIDLADAAYNVTVSSPSCDFHATTWVPMAPKVDTSNVRPGATLDFELANVAVPFTVLGVDGRPETGKALVQFRRAPEPVGTHPMDQWWTPEAPVLKVLPGNWVAFAEKGRELRSQLVPVVVTGAVPEAVSLHLEHVAGVVPSVAAAIDPSVENALSWLKRHQSASGDWGGPAPTGAALLAFLGAGRTHQTGDSRESVNNAAKVLRDAQRTDGAFLPADAAHRLRDHAIAALAIVESYGMTGSRVFKEPAQRAVDFALKSRTPSSGWGTASRDPDFDVESTVWMVMGLRSATTAKIDVEDAVFGEAVAGLDRVTDGNTGRVSGRGTSLSDDAATAAGAMIRLLAGRTVSTDGALARAVATIASRPPDARSPDPAYWYFGTLVMSRAGDETSAAWNAALKATVADRQRAEEGADERGSWDPATGVPEADRVYVTALGALTTEAASRSGRALGAK